LSGAVLFHGTKPPRRHTGASDREHGQINPRHDAARAAQKQNDPLIGHSRAVSGSKTTVESGLPELLRSHFNVTPKRPGFRPRTRAYASSRVRRPVHRRGDSSTAHNGATSMISMCSKKQIEPLMRPGHSDRQEPRHECAHYRLLESRAPHAVGNDQLLRLQMWRSSCPAPPAPPCCRRGSITVEDLEEAEASIDRLLGWLSSQPLKPSVSLAVGYGSDTGLTTIMETWDAFFLVGTT